MQAWPDIKVYLLAAGVIALFGWFFWHVVSVYVGVGKRVAHYLDSGSERRRAALEREIRFGKDPLWVRALRVIFVVAAFGLMALLFWNKLRVR
ncbi:hypothetical protein [Oricola sp.]|uniref:hypothetical protein n=1 Tax=Oricola sp. TaxID=1979950 RepID=UPI0035193B9D